ncbi:hypothetical protein Cantr_06654 [Candida viswanathii]|uniref:Uncharacterized protein n=1 Tax=Candida viswanathii TaxID=5486 RepID=A0A367XVA2_9ASCO|nr:hypothetical protein Cantr_06654 [Candida viswanathii]
MSAFLLVSDQATASYNKKRVRRNKTSSSAQSIISTSSSSGSAPLSSTTSFAQSQEAKNKKKVFDINTNSYVDYVRPAFEISIMQYDGNLARLKSSPNSRFNEVLNHKHIFDLKAIEMLRYTYFEDLNYNSVASFRLNQKKPNGDYKLSYMNKIARLTQTVEQGLPRFSLCEDEDGDDEQSDDDFGNRQNIQSILHCGQFWNNVFQEMKFESLQSKINYVEYLPSLGQLKNFYNEILEYFLCNMHILKPGTEGVTDPEEVIQLLNCHYVYFTEFNYEYFRIMKLEHDKLFRSCQDTNHRYMVYEKLLDIISTNIRAMSGNKQNPALPIWEQFLEFIFFEVLSQDYSKQQQQQQPNLLQINTNTTTAPPYNPPRNMLVSSRGSQHSFLSMGKTTRNGSVCGSERSPMSSPIFEESITPLETVVPRESNSSEMGLKSKKPSILKRLFGDKKM